MLIFFSLGDKNHLAPINFAFRGSVLPNAIFCRVKKMTIHKVFLSLDVIHERLKT
jgi:hypothetical protein